MQRLNGDVYGKGIYAATDLMYGKGFGRRQVELNETGDESRIRRCLNFASGTKKTQLRSKDSQKTNEVLWLNEMYLWVMISVTFAYCTLQYLL